MLGPDPFELRAYARAYRAMKAGAEVVELFDYEEIYERDGYICQICGRSIERDAPENTNRARSIDHIKPLSKGGDHTRENVQAAHRGCNAKKADSLPDAII